MTNRRVVAHCLAGHRPQPFISDQARGLRSFDPIVLARDRIDISTWGNTPIYASQTSPGWSDASLSEPGSSFNDVSSIFLDALERHHVHLMHAHHGMFALEFLALRRLTSLPLIVSFYGFDISGFPLSSPANAQRLQRLFDDASLVLAMSEHMRRDLIEWGCHTNRIALHLPAVDINRFSYRSTWQTSATATVRILSVSDFTPKKGTIDLIQAFAMVHSDFPATRLHLVGKPITTALTNYEETRRQIRRLSLDDWVIMSGWNQYNQQSELYAQHDIFVLPSKVAADGSKEGVPAVILEAMATGLPVVSTWHAGIPEVVVDGVTGILVAEGDVPALADAISTIVAKPHHRAAMGATGRTRVEEHFTVQVQRARLERFYRMVLNRE